MNSEKGAVVFDVDGVLADFYVGYRLIEQGLGLPVTMEDTWAAYLDDRVWKIINGSAVYWKDLPPCVSPLTFVRINALQYGREVYFVTARVGINPSLQTQTWLEFNGVHRPQVILTNRKAEACRAVYAEYSLEDKAGNAVAISYISPNTKSFLLDVPRGKARTHNQFDHQVIGGSVHRVDTVEDFLNKVE